MKIRLNKIRIRQYRSCKDCEFVFDRHLNAFIGPNGSGKTTILRAIVLLRQLARVIPYPFSDKPEEESEPTQIKVWLDINGKKVIHTVDIFIGTDENNNDHIVSSEEKWYMKDFTGERSSLKIPLEFFAGKNWSIQRSFAFKDSGRRMIPRNLLSQVEFRALKNPEIVALGRSISEFYEGITYYSASQFTNPSECPPLIEIMEGKLVRDRSIRDEHSKWLHNLFDIKGTDLFKTYLKIVGANGIGLVDEIGFEEVEMSSTHVKTKIRGKFEKQQRKQKIVIPSFSIGENSFSPAQLSEGTFKTLAMVFYLMTGKGNMVLLEEPEVCIHHGLLSSIIELVKGYSKEKQILLTTHSDYILDHLEPDNVVVVERDDEEGTSAKSLKSYLGKKDLSALKHFLNEAGSLGEYWRIGAIEDE